MEIEYNNKIQNIKISSKNINGILKEQTSDLKKILKINSSFNGEIIIDGKELDNKEKNNILNKITYVKEIETDNIFQNKIYDIICNYMINNKIYPKNKDKKIKDSLRIVGLDLSILERSIKQISTSEKRLLFLSMALILNPEVLIIDEPFKYLDLKTEKNIMIILRKIKDQYNKIIIFTSEDVEKIYKNSDYAIITKNNKTLLYGKTDDVFKNPELLEKNNVPIPEIINIAYKARKEKNIKIDYHKDIRDIIKDIYKHV